MKKLQQLNLEQLINSMNESEKNAFQKIIDLNKKNGQYVKATWKSALTPLKAYQNECENTYKVSTSVIRIGITYSHMKGVEKIENQEPTTQSWCSKVIDNILYQNNKSGEYYVRLYVGNTNAHTKKHYEQNNVVIQNLDLNKFRKSTPTQDLKCFYVKLTNLIDLK